MLSDFFLASDSSDSDKKHGCPKTRLAAGTTRRPRPSIDALGLHFLRGCGHGGFALSGGETPKTVIVALARHLVTAFTVDLSPPPSVYSRYLQAGLPHCEVYNYALLCECVKSTFFPFSAPRG